MTLVHVSQGEVLLRVCSWALLCVCVAADQEGTLLNVWDKPAFEPHRQEYEKLFEAQKGLREIMLVEVPEEEEEGEEEGAGEKAEDGGGQQEE